MAQGPEDEGKKPKKKVAKTLLFENDNALEALKKKAEEAALLQQAGEMGAVEAAEAEATETEATEAAGINDDAQANGEKPKRRVAKTLIFDPSAVVAAAEAIEAQAAAHAIEEAHLAPSVDAKSEAKDDAPILNIEAPPVKLFFEEGAEEQKPKRRVPKTMLFTPGELASLPILSEISSADSTTPGSGTPARSATSTDANATRRLSTKNISKSLVFGRNQSAESSEPLQEVVQPGVAQGESINPEAKSVRKQRGEQYVAKTMLDHSMLFDQVARNQHKLEEKAIEVAREKANEPFVPFIPITCKKKALACDWTWDETYSNERYRYCGMCQRPVYNFAGLEMAEAEAIILKAENRSKFTLFQRTDGKFMTGDCPRALKKRSDAILMTAGGFLIVVCLLVYMAMLPHPKPKPQQAAAPVMVTTGTASTNGTSSKMNSASKASLLPKGAKLMPGASHYDPVTKKMVVDVPVAAPAPPPVANTAGPNEIEQDWEFNTPQK